MSETTMTLDQQLAEFRQRKFLATPLAGAIAWTGIGIAGAAFESEFARCMSVFVGTGMILYLAMFVAKFTGEDFFGRNREKNVFDTYFLLTVAQAVSVYAIAIPFFLVDRSSLPMTVGILTGLMWLPFSGFVGHWVGIFHAAARTAAVLAIWYRLPDLRFVAIPVAIVAIYAVTLVILVQRHKSVAAIIA